MERMLENAPCCTTHEWVAITRLLVRKMALSPLCSVWRRRQEKSMDGVGAFTNTVSKSPALCITPLRQRSPTAFIIEVNIMGFKKAEMIWLHILLVFVWLDLWPFSYVHSLQKSIEFLFTNFVLDGLFDLVLMISFFFGLTLIITLFGILISLDLLHQSFWQEYNMKKYKNITYTI